VRIRAHSAPRYVVFSTTLFPHFSQARISSRATSSRTLYLNVRHQVSSLYKRTGKIVVLYKLIFTFLVANLKGKIFWSI